MSSNGFSAKHETWHITNWSIAILIPLSLLKIIKFIKQNHLREYDKNNSIHEEKKIDIHLSISKINLNMLDVKKFYPIYINNHFKHEHYTVLVK